MTAEHIQNWLLDSDPSIRWQVMRDLCLERESVFLNERKKIATQGWGGILLDRQREDGNWGDGVSEPFWQSNLCTLVLLRDMGLDPTCDRAYKAVHRVRESVTWGPEFGDSPFFEGEVEPCINGRVLMLGAYFGHASYKLLNQLLSEQLADGGWNCEAERGSLRSSFHTTICVLEGLLEFERVCGATTAITAARRLGEEYLIERQMFRRLSTGDTIKDRKGGRDWTQFSFPPTWHYDVLRGVDYLRSAGCSAQRVTEAIDIVRSRRNGDGTWVLDDMHSDPIPLDMEECPGTPSRWVTLRALRVLNWAASE